MLISAFRLHPYKLGFFLSIGQTFAIISSSSPSAPIIAGLGSWMARFSEGSSAILGMLISVISVLLMTQFKAARNLVWAALVLFTGISIFSLRAEPVKGYLVLCLIYLSMLFLRGINTPIRSSPKDFRKKVLSIMFVFAAANWSFVHIFRFSNLSIALIAVLISSLMICFATLIDLIFNSTGRRWLTLAFFVSLAFFIWPIFSLEEATLKDFSQRCLAFIFLGFFSLSIRYSLRQKIIALIESLFFHPEGAVTILFLILSSFGTLLLFSPLSATGGVRIRLLDAAFTAVSAVCVTGLNTLDFVRDFSLLGQCFVLFLIQVGGLGIMTLSSLAVFVMGERMSVQQESTIAKIAGSKIKDKVQSTLGAVLVFTFCVEAIGAALLSLEFWSEGMPVGLAVWKGIFTAVSAFCNAGFALDSDNLIGLNNRYLILHTIGILIILGGLSPSVALAVPTLFKGQKLSLQVKLVLSISIFLQFSGFFLFALFEWNNTLSNMDVFAKIHNAWFQSVTARTAGFNSIDISAIHQSSSILLIVLMFVGGSPGGTAGGIKTTTLAILFGAILSIFRGQNDITFYYRKIPIETVMRAFGVFMVSLMLGLLASMVLVAVQGIGGAEATFEVFSALGTVGLSKGITPNLDSLGKIIIILCMFLGRIGPLSVFIFIFEQKRKRSLSYPTEDIIVG